MPLIDPKNPSELVKMLEKHLDKKSNIDDAYVAKARKLTENLCKILLIQRGILSSIDSRFVISDLDKNNWHAHIGCESPGARFSIKIVQQLGNKAAHTIYKISEAELVVCKKALANVAYILVPQLEGASLSRKLIKARKKAHESSIAANKQFRSDAYVDAANALEDNPEIFKEKLKIWFYNVLVGMVRDKFGKVPDKYYFNKAAQQPNIFQCLEIITSTEVRTWVLILFNFTRGKSDQTIDPRSKVDPLYMVKDAFYALANEVYKDPEENVNYQENVISKFFLTIIITVVSIMIWLIINLPDSSVLSFNDDRYVSVVLVFLGAFMIIYVYELFYHFIPSVPGGLLRELSTIVLSISGIAALVTITYIIGDGSFLENQYNMNIGA